MNSFFAKKNLTIIGAAGILVIIAITAFLNISPKKKDVNTDAQANQAIEATKTDAPEAAHKASAGESKKKTAAVSQSASAAQIAADATATLAPTKRNVPVYGFNGDNTVGVSWNDKSLVDSALSFHMKMIRYPGGTIGNWWNWRKGWLYDTSAMDVKEPDYIQFAAKHQYLTHDLKTLKKLVGGSGIQVMYTLNMTTSTLPDQIAMLKYADSLGMPVKWIELGNELNVMNDRNIGRKKFPTSNAYGRDCATWIAALKRAFPAARICLVGENKSYYADAKDWNNIVLSAAPQADALAFHLYPYPEKILDNGSTINFKKLYNACLDEINEAGFANFTRSKIWVSEYNILWQAAKTPEQREKNKQIAATWGQALSTILMTSLLTDKLPNADVILNHNITGTQIFTALTTIKGPPFNKTAGGIGLSIWLNTANGMQNMDKLAFSSTNGENFNDYNVLGWKFSSGAQSSYILVNFTGTQQSINLQQVVSSNVNARSVYADVNATITNQSSYTTSAISAKGSVITLPPYSITTF